MKHLKIFQFVIAIITCFVFVNAANAQPEFTDKNVDAKIKVFQQALLEKISADGTVESTSYRQQALGAEALVARALIKSGLPIQHEKIKLVLNKLKAGKTSRTYARAMRVLVFAMQGKKYEKILTQDLDWLVENQLKSGGWAQLAKKPANIFDTAIALRALILAERLGYEIPEKTWKSAEKFLLKTRNKDDGFGYQARNESVRILGASNSFANASAAVCIGAILTHKSLADTGVGTVASPEKLFDIYEKLLEKLSDYQKLGEIKNWNWGDKPTYTFLEMLCNAPEFISPMTLGDHELDTEIPELIFQTLAETQTTAGNLAEDETVANAYALLSLSRAREPVMIIAITEKKLLAENAAAIANSCVQMTKFFRKPVHWRRGTVDSSEEYLKTAALVYISLENFPPALNEFAPVLSRYVSAGGALLVDPVDASFKTRSMLLDYLGNLGFGKPSELPKTAGVFNRPAATAGLDVSKAGGLTANIWLTNENVSTALARKFSLTTDDSYNFMINVVAKIAWKNWPEYKFSVPERKPLSLDVPANLPEAKQNIFMKKNGVDLKLDKYFGAILNADLIAAMSVGVRSNCDRRKPKSDAKKYLPIWQTVENANKAWLAGEHPWIDDYLANGGFAVLEMQSSSEKEFQKLRDKLIKKFGKENVRLLSEVDPIITGKIPASIGCDLRSVTFNSKLAKRKKTKNGSADIWGIYNNKKLVAVVLPHAVTASIAGMTPDDMPGYDSKSARRIALNIILYANRNTKIKKE